MSAPARRPLTSQESGRIERLFEEIQGAPMLPWQRLWLKVMTVVVRDDRA